MMCICCNIVQFVGGVANLCNLLFQFYDAIGGVTCLRRSWQLPLRHYPFAPQLARVEGQAVKAYGSYYGANR